MKPWPRLYKAALAARKKAYAPYSRFAVGAVLLTKTGAVYSGANIENASYGLTLCAERTALTAAIMAGDTEIERIVVVAAEKSRLKAKLCPPCGACRQVLLEFAPQARLLLSRGKEKIKTKTIEEMLPGAFRFKR